MITKLFRRPTPLTCHVQYDEFIKASEKAFDCKFDGTSRFYPWELPVLPTEFKLGVIVGSSGSGKSTMLKKLGSISQPSWNGHSRITNSVMTHFDSPDEAISKLGAVGLNSIPTWHKSYHVLSTGEKFRADLAYVLNTGALIDEYSSVVGRDVAKATSVSLSKYIRNNDIHNVVLATCHRDVLEWLEPDWVIDTDSGEFHNGFFLSGPESISRFTEQNIIYGECLKTITI